MKHLIMGSYNTAICGKIVQNASDRVYTKNECECDKCKEIYKEFREWLKNNNES